MGLIFRFKRRFLLVRGLEMARENCAENVRFTVALEVSPNGTSKQRHATTSDG